MHLPNKEGLAVQSKMCLHVYIGTKTHKMGGSKPNWADRCGNVLHLEIHRMVPTGYMISCEKLRYIKEPKRRATLKTC